MEHIVIQAGSVIAGGVAGLELFIFGALVFVAGLYRRESRAGIEIATTPR